MHARLAAALLFLAAASPAVADPATIYVNNLAGNDANDGSAGHPCATIQQGLKLVGVSGHVDIANTGKAYHETVRIENMFKGRASAPLVIEGNGATISGLKVMGPQWWKNFKDDVYWFDNSVPDPDTGQLPPLPQSDFSNMFQPQGGYYSQWQAPKIYFLDGKAAPVAYDLASLPPGGFFFDTKGLVDKSRRIYFRLPAGRKLADCKIELPQFGGLYVGDDYTVVRNVISQHSHNDGFDGFWGIGVVFENCQGSYNCDQGISLHGVSDTIIDGGLYEHNGSAGAADVMSSYTFYRNVVIRNNMSYGAYFEGLAHQMMSCRFYGNFGTQVSSGKGCNLALRNCLIDGAPPAEMPSLPITNGVVMENGFLEHCTIVNCLTGLATTRGGTVANCVFDNCSTSLISMKAEAVPNFSMHSSWLNGGTVTLGAQHLDATSWAEGDKNKRQFGEITWKNLHLQPPLFMVPDDSPDAKAGQYGLRPGAELPPWDGWKPVPVQAPPTFPHP